MRPEDVITNAFIKAADIKARKAMRARTETLPAEYVGTDSEGKGWVLLPGADSPTPVRRMAVEAAAGDTVSVTVGNGRAVVDSNISNPSAGLAGVGIVGDRAASAQSSANSASKTARSAQGKADAASGKADAASQEASRALASANRAETSAMAASEAATRASDSAATARYMAVKATDDAELANRAASSAQESADTAKEFADSAIYQLSTVQDVIGVLDWASKHGSFSPTRDERVQEGKVYFTYDEQSGDYAPVVQPVDEDIATYYELSVDEAMNDFILSHLAVTARGLWVLPSGIGQATDEQQAEGYKMLLAADGAYVYDSDGVLVTKLGENIEFGSTRAQYIGSEEAYVVFVPASGQELAQVRIGGNVLIGGDTPLSKVMGISYDSTFTKAAGTYSFTGYAYKGGVDVSDDYDPDFFVWYLRTETGDSLLGRGRQVSVSEESAGYHGTVVGGLEDVLDCYLVDEEGNRICADDGALLADLIWEV